MLDGLQVVEEAVAAPVDGLSAVGLRVELLREGQRLVAGRDSRVCGQKPPLGVGRALIQVSRVPTEDGVYELASVRCGGLFLKIVITKSVTN